MQCDPLVFPAGQPPADGFVLVRGVVVEHDVQFLPGVGGGGLLEEFQELLVPVPGVAGIGDLPGGDLEGGEQAGHAVAGVIVGLPFGDAGAQRQDRLGALQCLALGLLVDAQHDCVFWRVQVQAHDVADFRAELRVGGELEALGPVRLQAVTPPDPGHRIVADRHPAAAPQGG